MNREHRNLYRIVVTFVNGEAISDIPHNRQGEVTTSSSYHDSDSFLPAASTKTKTQKPETVNELSNVSSVRIKFRDCSRVDPSTVMPGLQGAMLHSASPHHLTTLDPKPEHRRLAVGLRRRA